MINTVLLDFGGVLAYPVSGNWFIPYDLFRTAGFINVIKLLLTKNRLNNAFTAGNEYLKSNHNLSTEDEEYEQFIQFYKIVFAELGINVKQKVLEKLSHSKVYDDYQIKFYDDAVNGIKALKEKYKVIIISDTWPSTKRVLNNIGIFELLDGLIMSCNYDETKGTTKLFEIAIDKYKLVPGECVFVDDTIENLKNSEKAGLKPVLMDRKGTTEEAEYPVVKCLDDINGVISGIETQE